MLGRAVQETFCDKPQPQCADCPRQPGCLYVDVFKNPGRSEEYPTFPAPFVLDAPRLPPDAIIKAGESLEFSITLFGRAVKWWREIVQAYVTSFDKYKEVFNASFKLDCVESVLDDVMVHDGKAFTGKPKPAVWSDAPGKMPDGELSVLVEFLSPVILKDGSKYEPDFASFMDAAFYRIASIIDIYGESAFSAPYALFYRKPYIKIEHVQRDGLLDGLLFTGKLTRYLPYIDLASYLHIGKQSTSGFGKFTYEVLLP
jgi:hypothetical protein